MTGSIQVSEQLRWLAQALEADSASETSQTRAALEHLAHLPWSSLRHHRLGPALALRAKAVGLEPPVAWQRSLLTTTAHLLRLQHGAERIMSVLGTLDIPWTVIKGFDLGPRVYRRAEERPTSDLDFLIAIEDRAAVLQALLDDGWNKLFPGPRFESYLRSEGYADSLTPGPNSGLLLEVHFRLWGLLPEAAAGDVLAAAREDSSLPPGGRRVRLAHAWILAAVHTWLDPPPRPLRAWWELHRIAMTARQAESELVSEVLPVIAAWGAELPCWLAATISSNLWPDTTNRSIADTLFAHLRWPERRLARHLLSTAESVATLADLGTAQVVRTRLLAGRPSRAGWRTLPRQIWAHPGIVEMQTPEEHSWPRRRWMHVGQQLRRWIPGSGNRTSDTLS